MKLIPNLFQKEALNKLEDTKERKGIIVMPTGTGKTFLASMWFKRKLEVDPKAKLLFVCHNKDILSQANEQEFQVHLNDFKISYGYYNAIEKNIKQVTFATTQTLVKNLEKFNKDYFDYIIIDECHHYQARTFKNVIKYFTPKFMLGLTATPNRMDMKDIYKILGKPIYTAKIFEAIKNGLLSKINYYAVDNDIDFTDIEWNGYKYSEKDLNKNICVKKYDDAILNEYEKHVKNLREKTICFCASVEHCYRMEELFRKKGISAVALTGKYEYKGIKRTIHHKKREKIIRDFKKDKYDIIFVRDLFNEGVDIPIADCIMMLRPTHSSTIYTQQIGRGLRKHKLKKDLLILDFTGNSNRSELNAEGLSNLLGVDVKEEIKKALMKKRKKVNMKEVMIVTDGGKIRLSKTKLKFFESYFSKRVRLSKKELIKNYFEVKKEFNVVRDISNISINTLKMNEKYYIKKDKILKIPIKDKRKLPCLQIYWKNYKSFLIDIDELIEVTIEEYKKYVKQRKKEYNQTPEAKQRMKEYMKKYIKKAGVL